MPLLAASALLLIGLWIRWPIVTYGGPPEQDAITQYMVDRFAYSDIGALYFRDGLADNPRPYLDYMLEYPVGIGLLIYLLNAASPTLPQYFLLTSLWMTLSALLIAFIVPRFPHGKILLFAFSPALALYVNLNWDMWGVLLMVVALYLFTRERDGWAAAVLAAAVWTKFFPIVFLPFLVADRWRRWGWRVAGRVVTVFILASAAINAPVLLASPEGWWYFFAFNAERGGDLNPYTLFLGWDPSAATAMNRAGVLLSLCGLVALLIAQWRSPPGAWLPACCAALGWFFFVGKVYSPQYGLWIVALLAVIGAGSALAVAWSATDLLYFFASFVALGLVQFGEAERWFVEHALEPAAYLREVILLVVIGWCIGQMRTPASKP